MEFRFIKAHGLGNDFAIFEDADEDVIAKHATFIADRKYGIGCDQVVLLADGMLQFWNHDGSAATFCGNACRCVLKHLRMTGRPLKFNTKSGEVSGQVKDGLVKIRYPCSAKLIDHGGYCLVDVGNRHAIVFAEEKLTDWDYYLREFSSYSVNIMYLHKTCGEWYMDIYELGAGETHSCGSGAMAAAVAIWHKENHSNPVSISMKGGSLLMTKEVEHLYQLGPAEIVYHGTIALDEDKSRYSRI